MVQESQFVLDFMSSSDSKRFYLGTADFLKDQAVLSMEDREITLFHIAEITFEDKAPRKEALENVISSLQIPGIHFVYLVVGNAFGVRFYFGISRDIQDVLKTEMSIFDIGRHVLEPSLNGNFRGANITLVKPECKESILHTLRNMPYQCCLEGVPGIIEDNEKFQGVDRLADVMLGDEFAFLVLAKPLASEQLAQIEDDLYQMYDALVPFSKRSVQDGNNSNKGMSKGNTQSQGETISNNESITNQKGIGTSISDTTGTSKNRQDSNNKGSSTSTGSSSGSSSSSSNKQESASTGSSTSSTSGTSDSKTTGTSTNEGQSKTKGTSVSTNTGQSINEGTNTSEGSSQSVTMEFANKRIQDWLTYCDEVLFKRLDYAKGKGAFITSIVLLSKEEGSLLKLENTARALFSGESGNKVPLRKIPLKVAGNRAKNFLQFQIPRVLVSTSLSPSERLARGAFSQFFNEESTFLGNWLSTNELSLIAGLPQKEIAGMVLKEEVDFGLNVGEAPLGDDGIHLGSLVQNGTILKCNQVDLNKNHLNKHVFITGVTGSGKTTTCQNILLQSQLPFLVLEPAKTEYRVLREQYPDLLVFTLGKDTVAPFRLNPFEFFPHESITSRVDMLKASIEAAFDMEAAIPQLIESAIYSCYQDCGWNIAKNTNERYENPFADGVYAFPILTDLMAKVETVVEEQGFDARLKNDYIGSIRARLQGLLVGAKGLMLNTRRSIDFKDLLDRAVVLELEEIRSASEKALVMGFVLTNLMEALKAKYLQQSSFKHITLVEEAHRLLSKYMPGDSPSKKQGVETFSDMLAEVRKYGEALMIVDQIPGKLTPEVLKNTNTKIVHKIFAQDDKEAIGNTMVLSDEQKDFLSRLETGRAIVFSQGWPKAVQVQIAQSTNTTSEEIIQDEQLRKTVLNYYCQCYRRGIFPGIEEWREVPSVEEFEEYLQNLGDGKIEAEYRFLQKNLNPSSNFAALLSKAHQAGRLSAIAVRILNVFYRDSVEITLAKRQQLILECITAIAEGRWERDLRMMFQNDMGSNK